MMSGVLLLPFLALFGAAEIARLLDSEKNLARRGLSYLVLLAFAGWIAWSELPAFRKSFDHRRSVWMRGSSPRMTNLK